MAKREPATLIYRMGRILGRFCFNVFGRLEIDGLECVPPRGPVILVCNHLSFTDPPVLVAVLPRPLHFVGKKELFANMFTRAVMRAFHVSSYDRSRAGLDAIKTLTEHLNHDRMVVLFPEGHRSPDHTLQKGMLGVVYLALKSQATILPVGVTGTHKISGWRMSMPLCRMTASIGPPFSLPVVEGAPSREVMSGMLDMIMGRVAAQLPPEFRGVYATSRANAADAEESEVHSRSNSKKPTAPANRS